MKKVKKVIGWTILAVIAIAVLSVPIIDMGWVEGLIILAIMFALSGIIHWAMDAITEGNMMHRDKQGKWFSNDTSTATVKAETVMPLRGQCYAVYPDAVRMGLSCVNECMAIFKSKHQAIDFGNSMWQDKWILKEVSL